MAIPWAQLPEYLIRRLYFSFPGVVAWYQRYKTRMLRRSARQVRWDGPALLELLNKEIPGRPDLMLHSSMAGLGPDTSPLEVLKLIRNFCGPDRTLLMPSHPVLRPGPDGIPEYDPARCPSYVGLITELARRSPDFQRSRHPISSVLACGPDAAWYLDNNLNEHKPLPHGIYSPYARLAERGGYAICLGVPFPKSLTIMHVAEEVLDKDFPTQLQFDELDIRVGSPGEQRVWKVRARNDAMIPHLALWRLQRDLVGNDLVKRFDLNGIIVDIANCRAVVEFMHKKALQEGYPYIFLRRRQ